MIRFFYLKRSAKPNPTKPHQQQNKHPYSESADSVCLFCPWRSFASIFTLSSLSSFKTWHQGGYCEISLSLIKTYFNPYKESAITGKALGDFL